MSNKKVDEKVKKEVVKNVKAIGTEVIDFGDVVIKQTNFDDGTSTAEIV